MRESGLTETVQNYLVNTLRLREADDAPVPLSQLAEALSVSPISVNDMCRKLQEQGLMTYIPYKGALLTEEGQRHAYYIIRRHRLWEVFLVERLGLDYDTAHDAACDLEHSTPDQVADRLDVFLSYPAVNPEGQPIPRAEGVLPTCIVSPISELHAGAQAHVLRCDVPESTRVELAALGIRPGATVDVLVVSPHSVLVQVDERQVSIARVLADAILVEPVSGEDACECTLTVLPGGGTTLEPEHTGARQVTLDTLRSGQTGVVVRNLGRGPARRRMMDMGLVPGSDVRVVRVAPLGDPIEFQVKGYSLSLRKDEAKDIIVEIAE